MTKDKQHVLQAQSITLNPEQGTLPKGWVLKKLGEVCDNLDNKRIPITKNKRLNGLIPYYGASGIVDYVVDYIFNENLLLVSEDGANLLTRVYPIAFSVNGKIWVNNHAHVLRFHNMTTQKFSEYYLNSIELDSFVSGMAQPKLNQRKLKSIPIPIPPIPEQEKIVAVLDQAFAAIDQAKANIEKNLQNAKELFQSRLNDVFSQQGEGWEEKKLGECLKLKSGNNLTSKNMNINGIYPVYGGNGVTGIHDKFNLEGEQVVIGRVGAKCGNVRLVNHKVWLTDNAFKISVMYENFDKKFLTYLLNYKKLRRSARQAAQPVISNSSIKGVILQFPSLISEQKQIVQHLDSLSAQSKQLEVLYQQKLAALLELKQSILQKAFAGGLV